MLGIAKFCRYPAIQIRNILTKTPRNLILNNSVRPYSRNVLPRQSSLLSRMKVANMLRGSGTMAIRLSSDASSKSKKAVGFWLLTCGGMVFVAVVLGISTVYYFILLAAFTVLEEVIKKTVR